MTQAARHERQAAEAAARAAEFLRQRQLLAPRPLAVYVRAALGGRRDVLASPVWLLDHLGALPMFWRRR